MRGGAHPAIWRRRSAYLRWPTLAGVSRATRRLQRSAARLHKRTPRALDSSIRSVRQYITARARLQHPSSGASAPACSPHTDSSGREIPCTRRQRCIINLMCRNTKAARQINERVHRLGHTCVHRESVTGIGPRRPTSSDLHYINPIYIKPNEHRHPAIRLRPATSQVLRRASTRSDIDMYHPHARPMWSTTTSTSLKARH